MCEKLKYGVQQLMNQKTILVEHVLTDEDVATLEILYCQTQILIPTNPVTPLVTIVPSPFPLESTKVVRWNYYSSLYIHDIKESVVNIIRKGGVTRSGRVFSFVASARSD